MSVKQKIDEILKREGVRDLYFYVRHAKPNRRRIIKEMGFHNSEWMNEAAFGETKFIEAEYVAKLEKLVRELGEMSEALKFYGAPANWCSSMGDKTLDGISAKDWERDSPLTKNEFCGGKLAREALTRLNKLLDEMGAK